MKSRSLNLVHTVAVVGLLAAGSLACTGCQVSVGGQTLPSAHYMRDDIQYFPKGPEMKLQREADEQKAARNASGGQR